MFLVETPVGVLAAAGIVWNAGVVRELAVALGPHAVDPQVEADNEAAIALYETLGMRRVESVASASAVAF